MENQIVTIIDANGKHYVGICVKTDENGEPIIINIWGVEYHKVGNSFKRKELITVRSDTLNSGDISKVMPILGLISIYVLF